MSTQLTPRGVAYLANQEGMVTEAYKDSTGVWTWALGVTNASGHEVYPRYFNTPQAMSHCLEVSVWLMRQKYLPAVDKAFQGRPLSEAETAAALSFHWNTGAIGKAEWVKDVVREDLEAASDDIMQWTAHGSLTNRRESERALFFDGKWPDDLKCPLYPINYDTHSPIFRKAVKVDIIPELKKVMRMPD